MTREELDFIGSMNMCDEISNEAYKKIVCHCREQEPCEDWYDVPSDEMTLEQARQAVKDLRKKLAELEQEPCDVFDEYGNYKYPSDVELTEPNTATSMPCEDEYIKVPKKALKYRTAGMVAYNAEWLKNHFDIERAVICGAQEPCPNAISRQDVFDLAKKGVLISNGNYESVCKAINELPSVNPQPKTGYISIDDVMSVFDDYMLGEVDEDGTDTFLKMLKDRAESEVNNG